MSLCLGGRIKCFLMLFECVCDLVLVFTLNNPLLKYHIKAVYPHNLFLQSLHDKVERPLNTVDYYRVIVTLND